MLTIESYIGKNRASELCKISKERYDELEKIFNIFFNEFFGIENYRDYLYVDFCKLIKKTSIQNFYQITDNYISDIVKKVYLMI